MNLNTGVQGSGNRFLWISISAVLLSVSLLRGTAAQAATEDEERQLTAAQQEVDRTPSAGDETEKVENLAKEFKVDPAMVQKMRDKRQGWGEISTQLAMAQQLSKTDSKTYPSTADALKRVEDLRDQGRGYGGIAKELGFKLGPVVSNVKRSETALRTTGRPERPESAHGFERPNRPDRADRPDHPGNSGKQR